MAQKGQITGFRVRGRLRFRHEDIDQWIDQGKAGQMGDVREGAPHV